LHFTQQQLRALISVVRTRPENARKRTGSFAPVVSTDNVQSGVESGRFELDLKLNDIDLAALSSD
jgi:hypothetical protein|tara:strand:- start:1933 stop:2127 length:195 start_codon:yes stop_codon:yes gene_type:complete